MNVEFKWLLDVYAIYKVQAWWMLSSNDYLMGMVQAWWTLSSNECLLCMPFMRYRLDERRIQMVTWCVCHLWGTGLMNVEFKWLLDVYAIYEVQAWWTLSSNDNLMCMPFTRYRLDHCWVQMIIWCICRDERRVLYAVYEVHAWSLLGPDEYLHLLLLFSPLAPKSLSCSYVRCVLPSMRQGYEGLVAGGDFIKKMAWKDVSMIIHKVWQNVDTTA